jgi:hypothetical protein
MIMKKKKKRRMMMKGQNSGSVFLFCNPLFGMTKYQVAKH